MSQNKNRSDLGTLRGRFWNGSETIDIVSQSAGGVIASVVDDKAFSMYSQATSIIDHITEPLEVDEYIIKELKCETTPSQWGLFRKPVDGEVTLLGCVTEERGAKNLLDYLKRNAN